MSKTAMIRARTEPSLKKEVEGILDQIGLSCSEAINLFFKQITLRRGIPFDVAIPNKTTLKAFKEIKEGKTLRAKNVEEMFKQLGI